jgi:hypothetical protein
LIYLNILYLENNHMRATEVFTPKGEPSITHVNDHLLDKAKRLVQDLSAGPCVVSLSGPSKSGKTVFIEKTLGRDRLIKVNGAGVKSAESLWLKVFAFIGTPVKVVETVEQSSTSTFGARIEGGVPLVTKGEVSVAEAWAEKSAEAAEAAIDYVALLVKELGNTEFIVFIDDFHYIEVDIQQEIARQIKEGIEGKVQFVCASVPYRSDDVLLGNADLRGRAYKVDFEYWAQPELAKIAKIGFAAMNLTVSPAMIDALASEAAGSPQLMQTLCLNLCFDIGHEISLESIVKIDGDIDLIGRVCRRTAANNDYSSTVAAMKDGPKTRGKDRKSYVLKANQTSMDVYPLILRGIASDPPQLMQRANEFTGRVQSLCSGEQPGSGSILNSCSFIVSIANEAEGRQVIEWDTQRDILDIRDPYLLFFLRHGQW